MNIAAVPYAARGVVDQLLFDVATELSDDGFRLAGVVRPRPESTRLGVCDADLTVLPTGKVVRITQNLGAHSNACRLDASALEEAVGAVEAALAQPVDLFVLNKFGLREAEGRGFRGLIGEALSRDIPVLLGLPADQQNAFDDFTSGLATILPAEARQIAAWARKASSSGSSLFREKASSTL